MDRPSPRPAWKAKSWKRFRRALRDERDGDVRYRFAAVNMHENLGMTREEVALALVQCPRWVGKWVARYRSGGVEALRDRPRPGRPPLVARQKLGRLIGRMPGRVTPAEVMLEIERATGVRFHMSHVRKIMRRAGLSAKRTRLVHVNRADGPTVAGWRRRVRREIRRLRRAGFTIVVQDETIAVHGAADGSKYWSRVGVPVVAPYTGGHRRVVVYGAISTDGKQIFRVHDRFDAETFVAFLRDMHRKFGRVAVIVDRAPQHRAAAVKDYLRAHRAVRLIELPTGSPLPQRDRGGVAAGKAGAAGLRALPHHGGYADGGVTALQAHEVPARRDGIPGPDVAGMRHGLLIGSIGLHNL